MSFVPSTIVQMKKMLQNLDSWLHKASEQADKKKFDPNTLLQARLAPDQYPLVRQVQSACDSAKFAAARLTGKEAPKNPDTEQTLGELFARIQSTTAFLDTFQASDFNGAESRPVKLPFIEGKVLTGAEFLIEMSGPNFYFHITHAYAILRHNGVELGKMDFIGSLPLRDA